MKTKLFIIGIILFGLLSCRGSSGKKAIQAGEDIIKSLRKVPKGKLVRQVAEEANKCPTCDGVGRLMYVDQWGNPIYYNGVLQTVTCDDCSGSGRRINY